MHLNEAHLKLYRLCREEINQALTDFTVSTVRHKTDISYIHKTVLLAPSLGPISETISPRKDRKNNCKISCPSEIGEVMGIFTYYAEH